MRNKKIKCPDCNGRGYITEMGINSSWTETCGRCYGTGYVFAPITNADRIRAMSDEELAEWLCHNLDCGICKEKIQCVDNQNPCVKQHVSVLEWLQQPAEGE